MATTTSTILGVLQVYIKRLTQPNPPELFPIFAEGHLLSLPDLSTCNQMNTLAATELKGLMCETNAILICA